MTIDELVHTIKVLLIKRQNNAHTGEVIFKIAFNQGGIRSCEKIETATLKDKRTKKK